jgi:hypothetical protein
LGWIARLKALRHPKADYTKNDTQNSATQLRHPKPPPKKPSTKNVYPKTLTQKTSPKTGPSAT